MATVPVPQGAMSNIEVSTGINPAPVQDHVAADRYFNYLFKKEAFGDDKAKLIHFGDPWYNKAVLKVTSVLEHGTEEDIKKFEAALDGVRLASEEAIVKTAEKMKSFTALQMSMDAFVDEDMRSNLSTVNYKWKRIARGEEEKGSTRADADKALKGHRKLPRT